MNMFNYYADHLPALLTLAGIGQVMLAAVSPLIPLVLRWREQTARLDMLTRQVFWTYAGYILVINLCFGGLGTSNRAAWFTTSSDKAGCGPDTRAACLPAGLCRQSRLAANGNAVAFHDDNPKVQAAPIS